MAVYLILKNKLTDEIFGGEKLIDVDNKLCQYLKIDPDPCHWHENWVNSIGMGLAFGKTFDEIKKSFNEQPEMLEIINWLDENFVSVSARRWR